MRSFLLALLLLLAFSSNAQFDKYFINKTMRIDYVHAGNDKQEFYYNDEIRQEQFWGGSQTNMIDQLNYGNYKFSVIDKKSGVEIYSRGYSTMFAEWQKTTEARNINRSFSESVVFPFPKNEVVVIFYSRDSLGMFQEKFKLNIDPKNYFISKEQHSSFPVIDIHVSAKPEKAVDIIILPEGYTKDQLDKFKIDCQNFANALFSCEPYASNKDKFNIRAVIAPSQEEGSDIPGENVWKKTLLNTTFYTFDSERYIMSTDNKAIRDLASNAPYDQIYILANTNKYGGGAIFNDYSVSVTMSGVSDMIILHEFGHAFTGLGDEYYNDTTTYTDFYSKNIEPWEPNLTTLKDFKLKWGKYIEEGTPVPTPRTQLYLNNIGVFEGGGYAGKGVYSPRQDCLMKSFGKKEFCRVCNDAILKMIRFYSE